MILNTKFIKCNLKYYVNQDDLYDNLDIYSKIQKLDSKINRYQKEKYLRLIKKYKLSKYARTFLKLNPNLCGCGKVTCGMNRIVSLKVSKGKSIKKHYPLNFEKVIKKYFPIINSNLPIEEKIKKGSKIEDAQIKKIFMELITGLLHEESFNLKSIVNIKAEIKRIHDEFDLFYKEMEKQTFTGLGLNKPGTIFTWVNSKTKKDGIFVIGTDSYLPELDENTIITSYCNTLLKLDIIK